MPYNPSVAGDSQPVRRLSGVALSVVIVVALALLATMMLWAHYGSAVFFEVIAAGLAACF